MIKPKLILESQKEDLLPWEGVQEIEITDSSVFEESAKKVAKEQKERARQRDLEDLRIRVRKEQEKELKRKRKIAYDLELSRKKRAKNVFNFERQTSKDFAAMQEDLAKSSRQEFSQDQPKNKRPRKARKNSNQNSVSSTAASDRVKYAEQIAASKRQMAKY